MIIGTGSDLVDMRRIENLIERFGERFIHRCFTEEEIRKAESRKPGNGHVSTYAKRFAAKEACAKALGTGFAKGVRMRDIGVKNDDLGRPVLYLSGGADKRLQEIVPEGHRAVLHLTLSDEPPLAKADVMIEAVPIL